MGEGGHVGEESAHVILSDSGCAWLVQGSNYGEGVHVAEERGAP